MASLIEQGGRYYLQFFDSSRQPYRKRVSLKTSNRRLAGEVAATLEARYVLGEYDPWASVSMKVETVGDAYAAFMGRKKNLRASTQAHYRWVLDRFVEFLGRSRSAANLSWKDIQSWLDSTDANHQSRYTYLTRIGIFCRFLVLEGILDDDISKEVPLTRPPHTLSEKVISREQVVQIAESALESVTPYLSDVVLVTYDLALRLSEVCAMRRSWLQLESGRLVVSQGNGFNTKNGREVMKPIPTRSQQILSRRCQGLGTSDPVFVNTRGSSLDPKRTSKAFKQIVRNLGLPESVTFHGLRHGGITRLIESGVNLEVVRRFAGHADLKMTLRYVHLADPAYENAIRSAVG